jgi:hypothetical protein
MCVSSINTNCPSTLYWHLLTTEAWACFVISLEWWSCVIRNMLQYPTNTTSLITRHHFGVSDQWSSWANVVAQKTANQFTKHAVAWRSSFGRRENGLENTGLFQIYCKKSNIHVHSIAISFQNYAFGIRNGCKPAKVTLYGLQFFSLSAPSICLVLL